MIEIIPAIDLIGGQCVRLSQGDYQRQTTYGDPVEIARSYADSGLQRLHLVDLDGAKAAQPVNLRVLERIAAATGMDIEYGGGIKSRAALESVFDAGASRAIGGSIAVTAADTFREWLAEFSPARIILGADVRDGFIATHGWLEDSQIPLDELLRQFLPDGLSQVICTDISKDGMLGGPNFELYGRLQESFPHLAVTVSGGISSLDDIRRLDAADLHSVIVGKALYEGRITLKELSDYVS
jgi:phosphoribosylformimino-5-aminoimidazole carboxamide ribotide isomerase